MGLPSINIAFKTKAAEAVNRSRKGVVALIIKDGGEANALELTSTTQIPTTLGKANQEYIQRAFVGYVNPPRKVLVYVLPAAAENLTEAMEHFATQSFDYLAGPPDIAEADCTAIVSWVKSRRLNDRAICKAVLPNTAADSEAIVNVTTEGIKVGDAVYASGQYCSRAAGLLCGTPMDISSTFAPLPEVSDVARLSREEMDAAVDNGEFIFFHDGEKVKVGRGVNSLKTVTADKGAAFKKIKVVETADMIQRDLRITVQDNWIGKRSNSYDNKQLLITAIKGYMDELERAGILVKGATTVGIDLEAQEAYLKSIGIDTSKLTEQQIKEHDTGDKVFLMVSTKILDAIEDVAVVFYI